MPSRNVKPPQPKPLLIAPAPAPTTSQHHASPPHFLPSVAAAGACFSLFITLAVCFCKISRKRTAPAAADSVSKPPHEFSYSSLRRATANFSDSNRLGRGGFGSVYRADLPTKILAVKIMDAGSLQGEREFQNELFFGAKLGGGSASPFVVAPIGFSHDRKRRRMLLVYDLMENGNLQDALLHRRSPEIMDWKRRFSVIVDIARGIEYLHGLGPPVIHGDIKPSNVLLNRFFEAKVADFGLARLKPEDVHVTVAAEENVCGGGGAGSAATEEYGSVVEEVESVITTATGFDEFNLGGGSDQSPESVSKVVTSPEAVGAVAASPDTTVVSVSPEMADKVSILGVNYEKSSDDCERELVNSEKRSEKELKRDWWWKQENGAVGSVRVKDYVMEWIGSEVKKERPSSDWIAAASSSSNVTGKKLDRKKSSKRLEWWISLDEEKEKTVKKKRRPVREWWREEYCEELARKKKEKKKKSKKNCESETYGDYDNRSVDQCWPRDEELYAEGKTNKKKRGSRSSSLGSVDWWLDGLSGDLWRARRNSHDSVSGEIAKSCGISSTPSMRGTVCYVAPEYGNIGDLSEKCDVYSYGVLLLVLVAGRRPLEVTGPASEIQRANLMSWTRHLARRGKLLELVDQRLQSVDQEQVLLCIKVALLCLQKSPVARPSMKEVVGILTGELDPPELPTEFSPSPPSRLPFKSRKKGR